MMTFFSKTGLENLLSEIIENFQETSSKKIKLFSDQDKNKIFFQEIS